MQTAGSVEGMGAGVFRCSASVTATAERQQQADGLLEGRPGQEAARRGGRINNRWPRWEEQGAFS